MLGRCPDVDVRGARGGGGIFVLYIPETAGIGNEISKNISDRKQKNAKTNNNNYKQFRFPAFSKIFPHHEND